MTLSATTRAPKQKTDIEASIQGVVYGHGLPSRSLTFSRGEFARLYRQVGQSSLFDLSVDGAAPVKVLVHDIQVNPVNMNMTHIDFRQIRMDEAIKVTVPLVFTGESLAVKGLGGTLVKSLDDIEVECLPDKLPKEIAVDISVLATFDDHINVGSLKMPEGVKATNDPHATIASVEPPLTEDQLKKLEAEEKPDVTAIKTEAEEKKEKEAADKAAEEAAAK